MPPKRKPASDSSTVLPVGSEAQSERLEIHKKGKTRLDQQANIAKYGVNTRTMRSQNTKQEGKDTETVQEKDVVGKPGPETSRRKGAMKEGIEAAIIPPKPVVPRLPEPGDVPAKRHGKKEKNNASKPVLGEVAVQCEEPESGMKPAKGRGKRGKKVEEDNQATNLMDVDPQNEPEEEQLAPGKSRGKGKNRVDKAQEQAAGPVDLQSQKPEEPGFDGKPAPSKAKAKGPKKKADVGDQVAIPLEPENGVQQLVEPDDEQVQVKGRGRREKNKGGKVQAGTEATRINELDLETKDEPLAPVKSNRKCAKKHAKKENPKVEPAGVDGREEAGGGLLPPAKPRGKGAKKQVEKENLSPVAEDVNGEHLEHAGSSGDLALSDVHKEGFKTNPGEAAEAAEDHLDAEEATNGSEAPKEVNKRGRKGKPNANKKEPEPDEKKAKLEEEEEQQPENYDCDKPNKKGEKWNMKIATWNVASLRACVKKGMLDYVAKEDADIICFQETKCSEQKAPPEAKVEGYHTYWCSGSGKNDGYAGVALFTKEKPLNVNYGIGEDEFDGEGRLITAEYDKFYLVTTYVPNSGQGLKTLPKRMKWNGLFLSYIKKLDAQKPVVVCGDLNVAHEEIDLKNPKTNTKNAGFTPEERADMTKLLGEGFVDSFRKLYPDRTGAYTFWSYLGNARARNTGWRLDYFVLSERLMDSVCDVVIRNKVLGSDHCPTTLFIHI